MSYFGAFHRMFVHFHFHFTHKAACESLHDLDFCSQYLTTCCNVWTLYAIIFSSILKFIYCFNIYITCICLLLVDPHPCTKLVYQIHLSLTINYQIAIIFIYKSTFLNKLSNFKHLITWWLHGSEDPIVFLA